MSPGPGKPFHTRRSRAIFYSTQDFQTAAEQRLRQLIRQPGPITDRTIEIAFLDPDVQA